MLSLLLLLWLVIASTGTATVPLPVPLRYRYGAANAAVVAVGIAVGVAVGVAAGVATIIISFTKLLIKKKCLYRFQTLIHHTQIHISAGETLCEHYVLLQELSL